MDFGKQQISVQLSVIDNMAAMRSAGSEKHQQIKLMGPVGISGAVAKTKGIGRFHIYSCTNFVIFRSKQIYFHFHH